MAGSILLMRGSRMNPEGRAPLVLPVSSSVGLYTRLPPPVSTIVCNSTSYAMLPRLSGCVMTCSVLLAGRTVHLMSSHSVTDSSLNLMRVPLSVAPPIRSALLGGFHATFSSPICSPSVAVASDGVGAGVLTANLELTSEL